MKKLFLFALLPLVMAVSCAPEAKKPLPPVGEDTYTVVLDAASSTLTTDDSVGTIAIELHAQEDASVVYQLEIVSPCYLKTVNDGTRDYTEIIMKEGSLFRSKSTYKVDRLILDIYEGQGINYEVYNNVAGTGAKLDEHESTVTSVYAADSGAVYEYEVDSTEWSVRRVARKPGIYSVTIVFELD